MYGVANFQHRSLKRSANPVCKGGIIGTSSPRCLAIAQLSAWVNGVKTATRGYLDKEWKPTKHSEHF